MAKDLPYFKFFCSEWTDGDITLEDYETQGVFINICSYYWSNECDVTFTKLYKKFRGKEAVIKDLLKSGLIKECVDDEVSISFLDEQREERIKKSNKNSLAGKASAKARKLKKIQQEINMNLTDVEHSLSFGSAESQPLREEEKREEKKRKDNTSPAEAEECVNHSFKNQSPPQEKEKEKSSAKKEKYSSEVINCFNNCLLCFPESLHPKNINITNNWLDTIDKLNRIDKIPFELIEEITDKVRKDDFWSSNFMSLTKLRKTNKEGIKYIVVFYEKFKNNSNGQSKQQKQEQLAEITSEIRKNNPNI